MNPFSIVSLGTNLFKGYSLEEAIDMSKEWGFDYIELSLIMNMCEHVEVKDMNDEKAAEVKSLLSSKNMKCYAVSGHSPDITQDDQFEIFLKKLEFAGKLGAGIININAGVRSRKDEFYKKMPRAIAIAEKYGIKIGLESHGDIVNTAKDSIDVFKHFNHPLVRLNYDTGNTLFYNPTGVDVAEDMKYGFEYLDCLHLKDIFISGTHVEYTPIGDGNVNFADVFDTLKQFGKPIPCGYEIPVHVMGILGNITPRNTPMSKEAMQNAVGRSVSYVSSLI